MNIRFYYQYRCRANWKNTGEVIFSNPEGLPEEEIHQRILKAISGNQLFIAEAIHIPERYEEDYDPKHSHGWHEYLFIEECGDKETDKEGRSTKAFLEVVEEKSAAIWTPVRGHEAEYLIVRFRDSDILDAPEAVAFELTEGRFATLIRSITKQVKEAPLEAIKFIYPCPNGLWLKEIDDYDEDVFVAQINTNDHKECELEIYAEMQVFPDGEIYISISFSGAESIETKQAFCIDTFPKKEKE
ncbi:MAG: hypothetical protein H8E29_00680 [Anaerolineales bacterium]|uniref:Uncharacterized protein n=1 Tax=Candidatus Desulfolinea nitratireducens TaxID=2841698 RepID=A0A8J6NH88_9CHLR|nr:hypothetical protein [Candidatus Desulfolinea nitratireducens]